jgi:CHORD
MKVLLHYEDIEDTELWKSLKITLPKAWRSGPTSQLLGQFVESYNGNQSFQSNPLQQELLHLAVRQPIPGDTDGKSQLQPLASDAIVLNYISDRADVYIRHGASQTLQEMQAAKQEEMKAKQASGSVGNVQCTRFGCKQRFPPGGPYPSPCTYHKAPPVFHETAKFWSCCPLKKAYDWEDFQNIPGCCEAESCTDVKEDSGQKLFLGGTDLREKAGEAVKLKSIDDFNKSLAAGGSDAAPVLERLQTVLEELGIERELYEQVVNGMRLELSASLGGATVTTESEAALLDAIKSEMGSKIKACLKAVAAEQLRIK